jgi:hypothetical protein
VQVALKLLHSPPGSGMAPEVFTAAPLASLAQVGHTRLSGPGAGSALMELAMVEYRVLVRHRSVRLAEKGGDGSGEAEAETEGVVEAGQLLDTDTMALVQAPCPNSE